jgi:hypothetical protein
MTIEEAIKHCEENSLKEEKCKNFCCAEEHRQLADWLGELLRLRSFIRKMRDACYILKGTSNEIY